MVLQNHESRTNQALSPLPPFVVGRKVAAAHVITQNLNGQKKFCWAGELVVGCHRKLGGFQNLEQSLNRSIVVQSR